MAQRKKTTSKTSARKSRASARKTTPKRAVQKGAEALLKTPAHMAAAKNAPFYGSKGLASFETGQNYMEDIQKTMGALFQTYDFKPHTMETMMTQGKTQFEKISQDAASLGRDHVEALIKSGSLFAKGFEEILRASMSLAQDAAEKQAQYVKQAMGAKTLNEWAEVQNKIAQTQFDDFMSGATRISELGVKVLTQSTEPLSEQINKTVQKASQRMAA